MKNLISIILFLCLNSVFAGVPKGVDWYQGSVEDAFKEASKQNKHLFLYWGAIWCPPCNSIKKKVFTNPLFQKEVKNFLAIYLDGDTDRAQIWGDKLKASGYPTMLVLDPKGNELMRFPTSIDAIKYTELLKATRNRSMAITELIDKKRLSDSEWSQLAFYSWGQNKEVKERLGLFEKLYNKIPKRLRAERASLFLAYLGELVEDKEVKRDKNPLRVEFVKLLEDKALAKRFTSDLSYSGAQYLDYLFEKIDSRVSHHAKLKTLLKELSTDSSLSVEERLFTYAYEMNLVLENPEELKKFQKKLLLKVKETDLKAVDGYSRQDAMSTAIWMLKKSKLLDEAKSYAIAELDKSIAPYYFMSYIASVEAEQGNIDESIKWRRRAWMEAKGGSTRFQWGTSYLTNLIENNKKKNFSKDFKVILTELLKQDDAFNGRNKKRLERLQKSLSKLKDKTFNLRVKAIVIEACGSLPNGKACHQNFKDLKMF
ncbi:MAG: thioredoxin-related protein [Bacteriovoracaceae bacterium]|jgi:thioredoxin-related protein